MLVLIVILVFLQDWRARAGAGDDRAGDDHRRLRRSWRRSGFTVNMLTLFGLVLAIGIVVDDAIVIVENAVAPHRARACRRARRRSRRWTR